MQRHLDTYVKMKTIYFRTTTIGAQNQVRHPTVVSRDRLEPFNNLLLQGLLLEILLTTIHTGYAG